MFWSISAKVLTLLALAPNFNELIVSSTQDSWIEHVITKDVKLFPVNESWSNRVNFDYLNGICSWCFTKAFIVFPRQDSEKLIFFAYYSPYPYTFDFDTFYEPAKSIKFNLLNRTLESSN